MPHLQRVTIVGPGAIGGLLAARFARAGFPVSLLGKEPNRILLIRRKGLWIERTPSRTRRDSGVHIPVRLFEAIQTNASRIPPPDLLFFCVKSYDTAAAIRRALPLARRASAVVSIQNGLSHAQTLKKAFGSKMVLGACYIAATRLKPNRIRHVVGDQIFLASHPANRPAAEQAQRVLASCGWNVRATADEKRLLWTKLVLNASGNPLGALCGVTNEQLALNPALREIQIKAIRECLAVMRKSGIRPLFPLIEKSVLEGDLQSAGQKNSMLQDIEAGRRTEVDSILLPILKTARKLSQPVPILENLYRFVKGLEKNNRNHSKVAPAS